MPTDIATLRYSPSKPASSAFSVFGVPLMIWALALLLVGAIAHLNPPIATLDAVEVTGPI